MEDERMKEGRTMNKEKTEEGKGGREEGKGGECIVVLLVVVVSSLPSVLRPSFLPPSSITSVLP
jgi:hypothetical protein